MADINSLALDLDLFDNTKNGYVPVERKRKIIPAPELVAPKKKTKAQIAAEVKQSRKNAFKAGVIAMAALILLASTIYFRVEITNRRQELADAKAELAIAQSDNVRLNMKFNSTMSMDFIEDYAQSELGMVKRESYQVRYFDMNADKQAE